MSAALVFTVVVAAPAAATFDSEAKVIGYDSADSDFFGNSVDIDGATLIVGAPGFGSNGAVYIYFRTDGVWSLQQKILPSVATTNFGWDVVVQEDTAVVGTRESTGGRAFVYTRSSGIWSEQQVLVGSDIGAGDYFGSAVALDLGTVAVGAPEQDSSTGAVYVFTRSKDVWTEQQKIVASDQATGDLFGDSVSISGDTVAVGARGETTNRGAVYVHTRSGSSWTQQQKITLAGAADGDRFGRSVDVDGDLLVAGAPGTDGGGTAFVYSRSGSTWSIEDGLARSGGGFGSSVAIAGGLVVVAAPEYQEDTGSVYVFDDSPGYWFVQQAVDASDRESGDGFGTHVTTDGTSVAVGAPGVDAAGSDRGAVYVYGDLGGPTVFVPDDIVVGATSVAGAVVDFSSRVGAMERGFIWEHLNFSFSENALSRNPGTYSDHVEFRKAIAYAIDRDALVAAIPGAHLVLDSYLDAYRPDWSQRSWSQYGYDPVMAGYWLAALCAKPGVNCDVTPPSVVFTTATGSTDRAILADEVESMLEAVGIEVTQDLESGGTFFGATLDSGGWDVGEWAWVGDADLPTIVGAHDVWYPNGPWPTGANVYRYGTPAVTGEGAPFDQGASRLVDAASALLETIIEEMADAIDVATLRDTVQAAEGLLADEMIFLPLYARVDAAVASGPTCSPVSGSTFPIGTTTVTCTALDEAGNLGMGSFDVTVLDPAVERFAGGNRYGTAADVSFNDFPDPADVDTVFIAVGGNFPDALAGAAVAGRIGAPLLLVTPTSIPAETSAELTRLDPDEIVILGGTAVVSPAVETALGSYAPTVTRLAGSNRYATAVEISQWGFPETATHVFVATGEGFADALAGAPAAVHFDGPVLLTPSSGLPTVVADEIARLDPMQITVIGGSSVVPAGVFSALQAIQPNTIRLFGANRYETAVEISEAAFSTGSVRVYVATGLNFPDALAGAAAAGWHGAPILLIPATSIPTVVSTEIARLGASQVIVLGGDAVISPSVAATLDALVGL